MERLTKREQLACHNVAYVSDDDCFGVWSVPEKFMGNAIDRLAAYEDTNLEPNEIRQCWFACRMSITTNGWKNSMDAQGGWKVSDPKTRPFKFSNEMEDWGYHG